MKKLLFAVALFTLCPFPGTSFAQQLPQAKDACLALHIQSCDVERIEAFSAIDLNGDGTKEIIFAYEGGSCGAQHYIFTQRNNKWVRIANWCGMDGGGYNVLSLKHKGYSDIDTGIGIIRFNGSNYPDTTKK
jgi:hypothetical protein